MKKILSIMLIAAVGFACEDKFAEINTNNNQPEELTLDVLIVSAESLTFERFGWGYDRYAGAFTQHFAGNHATGINQDQYNLQPADFNLTWEYAYKWAMMDCKQMIDQGTEQESWHYVAVGQTMTAMMLGYLTDVYGDIPYTASLGGSEMSTPTYDTQEEIYTTIQNLLDEALANFDRTSVIALGASDIAFGGDVNAWKAAVHAIKARYYNHLSKIDPTGSANNALSSLNEAYALGFDGSNDMIFAYDGTATHQNPWNTLFQNNLIIASENFMNTMLSTNDPRIHAYWDTVGVDGTIVGLVGKQNGYGTDSRSYSPVGPNGYFGAANSPIHLMTFFEAKFIEAEANYRLGNMDEAAAAHNLAVQTQIAKVVSDAAGLDLIDAYVATYAAETGATISEEMIMTEKYKAMFTQGIESWVDVRRYDYQYPSYLEIPVTQAGDVVADEFVRRVPYPSSERDFNIDNQPTVSIFDRLWWDQ